MLPSPPAPAPAGGWRRLLYRASCRVINPGNSRAMQAVLSNRERIAMHFAGGARSVGVLAPKGGVGKTSLAVLLGMALGLYSGDKAVVADGNPDRGTAIKRTAAAAGGTVRDVARAAAEGSVRTWAEMTNLVAHDPSGAHLVGSDADPEKTRAFTGAEYQAMLELFRRFYGYVVTDCGTDLTHEVTRAVLTNADGLVLVTGAASDEASVLDELRDLLAVQYRGLLSRTTLAIQHRGSGAVDTAPLESRFTESGAAVCHLPYDAHLAQGGPISWGRLSEDTRRAATGLAARVVEGAAGLR